MAALTALAIASLAGSVFNAVSSAKQKPKAPPLPVSPPAPKPIDAAPIITRARAMGKPGTTGRAATLLTGPTGLSTPAATQGKTLLGL
jgi:hypothetical protein